MTTIGGGSYTQPIQTVAAGGQQRSASDQVWDKLLEKALKNPAMQRRLMEQMRKMDGRDAATLLRQWLIGGFNQDVNAMMGTVAGAVGAKGEAARPTTSREYWLGQREPR